MTLGVIGEYLGRMFNETKKRPLYLIEKYRPSANNAAASSSSEPVDNDGAQI
jgi:hypothetical protein